MSNSDTQLLSGYQQNHRLQSVGYNTSHTHSYSLATSKTTDHKVLATTRPTHTVTVWLPVKSQTTKDCLQHVPHSYCLATSEITDHKVLSTTCPTQLLSGYLTNHRPHRVVYNMSQTVTKRQAFQKLR